MKKLFTIIAALMLAFNISAQQVEKGTLLLEGTLSGTPWTGLATKSGAFGLYLVDGYAMTIGTNIGIVESEILDIYLGNRIHFTESSLLKVDLMYYDLGISGIDGDFGAYLGYAMRFYYRDWMSIQPQMGFTYSSSMETVTFNTGVGFNLHFEK